MNDAFPKTRDKSARGQSLRSSAESLPGPVSGPSASSKVAKQTQMFSSRSRTTTDLFVLRYHLRGVEICRKEVALLQALHAVLPVPELINADISGDENGTTYLLYRYVHGPTFREIRQRGSSRDMADAARAIGRSMSVPRECPSILAGTQRPPEAVRDTQGRFRFASLAGTSWCK